MRVLHLLNDVTDRGNGIVNTAVDLAIAQARQGLDVAVISAGGGYQSLLSASGVRHFTLDQPRSIRQAWRAIHTLRGYFSSFEPKVVHAHMRTGLLLAWVLRRMSPFVLISHVHNVHDRGLTLMGIADRVIAVSESVAGTIARRLIPKRKIRVVVNRTLGSVRVPALHDIRPVNLQHPAIVTVCGMSKRKGIEELLHSFESIGAEFDDVHLYLVGDGPDREQFEMQAKQSRFSERIHFEGFQRLPQSYMLSADVFVLASRRESFGLVLIEAREAGCAIVATNVDGVSEALDGGNAGILVAPRSPSALTHAVGLLLLDKAEVQQWRHKAQEGISRFRVEQMAFEMKAIYGEALALRGAPSLAGPIRKYSAPDSVKR
jgi:glycosyltransferase involved in cell wall biosynthesis